MYALRSNEQKMPSACVTSVHTVVRDGWYNAFTDLTCWKHYYWLSYRRGTSHHADHGMVVVLRSLDLHRWHEAAVFDRPQGISGEVGSGVQDGHFCAVDDRLYLFFTTRVPLGMFVSWTDDGITWSMPQATRMQHVNPYTWRVRHHDGLFYSAVALMGAPHHEQPHLPLDLLVSDDGVTWRQHAQIAAVDACDFTEEQDLLFQPNGELWCVVRTAGPTRIYWAHPPYTDWHGGGAIGQCHAPALCALDGQVFLAGRIEAPVFAGTDTAAYPQGTTALYHLTRDGARPLLAMPVGGDSAYPGLISPAPGKLVMSYYSDVAYWSGILTPKSAAAYEYKRTDSDIYLAEIDVATEA